MDKNGNRRKYVSTNANSLIAKYKNSGDNETENCRKCRQANDLSHERNERRQLNPIDSTTNYYSTEYKPRKHHGSNASRTKYLVPKVPEESYRIDNKNYKNFRTLRNQLYVNNVAIVRKNNYKDDEYDEEERKYLEEDNELTGDENAEEETIDDVADENCENASEYDQQEADDEVDDESDAFERPAMDRIRIPKKTRTEPVNRCRQRNEPVEPSQHHRGHKIIQSKNPARCCHPVADRDTIDIQTKEEDEEAKNRELISIPPRKSSWRNPTSNRDREAWNQSRNLIDRYGDLIRTSLVSTMSSRRPRTTRPEPEALSRSAQFEPVRNRKSNRCAGSFGHAPKTTSSRNATCRLQDSRYFIKEQNGDEGEYFEEPESPTMYQTKSRKSKESKSPIYESRDETRTHDAEIGAIYKSCRSKNLHESSNDYRECTKHLIRGNRQDSTSGTLKNNNRYWPL